MKKIAKALSLCLFLFFCFSLSACEGCAEKQTCSNYDICVSLDNNVLSGKQIFTFYNCYDNAFSELKFNLFGNAFRQNAEYSPILPQYLSHAYPNGINYGDMQIKSCVQNGKDLVYSIGGKDKNILTVCLPKEVYPQEKTVVEIEFSLNLANVIARTGINEHAVNLGNFYPILCGYDDQGFFECEYYGIGDPFFSECSNYTVSLTCNDDYVVASSGKKIRSERKNDKTTWVYSINKARSFAMVLSEEFKTLTKKVNNVEITYYYYSDDFAEESLNSATAALSLFSDKFGQYPYETFSVVQTCFVQGGMEYPALVMISDNLEKSAYTEVIVHETAHQWWQTAVGNNEVKYGFLDEGLAEYSVVLFYENNSEYGYTRERLINSCEQTYKLFCSVTDKIEGKTDTSMLRSLSEFKNEYEYVNIAYVKPCIMFDILRKTVGEKRFFGALKNYFSKYCFKNAEPYDLVGVFEKYGADSNGFFESFFNGSAIL